VIIVQPVNHAAFGPLPFGRAGARGITLAICLIALVLGVAAGRAEAVSPVDRDVNLEIAVVWEDRPLPLAAEVGSTSDGARLTVSRLDFLLSGMALRREDGAWLEEPNWFAVFRSDKGRFTARIGGVPARRFNAIRFQVGVDPRTNAADPSGRGDHDPLHPLVNGLHRGSRGGFIFLAVEGRCQRPDGTFAPYSWHVEGDANLMHVELPLVLGPTGPQTIRLALDVEKIFRGASPVLNPVAGEAEGGIEGGTRGRLLKSNVESAFRVRRVVAGRHQEFADAVPGQACGEWTARTSNLRATAAHACPRTLSTRHSNDLDG